MAEAIGTIGIVLIAFMFFFGDDVLSLIKTLSDNKFKREQERTQQKQLDLAIAQRHAAKTSTTPSEE